MANQTSICNLALGLCGAARISSITAGSIESDACAQHWDNARDATLAAMQWSFARKRATLTYLSTDPDFGWDYQYLLPGDFLSVIYINEGTDPKWVIEDGNLLINEDEVELVYIFRQTDVGKWSSHFNDALAARLAADISPIVTRDFERQKEFMQLFDLKIKIAFDYDANREVEYERPDMDADNYSWISIRR